MAKGTIPETSVKVYGTCCTYVQRRRVYCNVLVQCTMPTQRKRGIGWVMFEVTGHRFTLTSSTQTGSKFNWWNVCSHVIWQSTELAFSSSRFVSLSSTRAIWRRCSDLKSPSFQKPESDIIFISRSTTKLLSLLWRRQMAYSSGRFLTFQ